MISLSALSEAAKKFKFEMENGESMDTLTIARENYRRELHRPEPVIALCEAFTLAREALEFYHKSNALDYEEDYGQKAKAVLAEISKRVGP